MAKKNKGKYAIKVKGVSKTFEIPVQDTKSIKSYFLNPFRKIKKEKFEALKDVSFKIKNGEFVGLIGRNGSGKTTLLRIIADIYEPDSGEITVNGKLTPFLELGVGFSYELSARDNIFLNGVILGMKKELLIEKFDEIVEFAEVREFLDTPLKNFSSGMEVRLAFSIAIQTSASIYLLDEVLAVGDAKFQKKCLDHIRSMKQKNKSILFVSHNMEDIKMFCDKVIVLEKGEVIFDGKTDEAIGVYKDVYKNKGQESEFKSI